MAADQGDEPGYEAILRDLLARYPELLPYLRHLCDVWDRQGTPPTRLQLGQGLSRHGDLAALRALFGPAVHLSRSGDAALEGYPNTAVRRLLKLLPSAVTVQHWGDSDLDGLRIAAILAQDRPLQLWRCGHADLERQRECLVPLSEDQRRRARHWLQTRPGFRFRAELQFTVAHGWLEQESWQGT